MWEHIKEQIAIGDYIEARTLLEQMKGQVGVYDDTLGILEASICEGEQDDIGMFEAIRKGLGFNAKNYELYYMLGLLYAKQNIDQAYLCFQNALLYCNVMEDYGFLEGEIRKLEKDALISVKKTMIVIVSYNNLYLQQKNIESIRETLLPGSYQIVVVDNASTDGVCKWLSEQSDVLLVQNDENCGFPVACNQGVHAAVEQGYGEYDVFLLNNDTRLANNSLFWLKMGLYENESIGATGSCSNYVGNEQAHDVIFSLPDEYVRYGEKINIPMSQPYEERTRLSGFAMLIRAEAWQKVGGMDEAFTPGYFEDDDFSIRLAKCGYRLLFCRNSFIYHAGSQSFSAQENVEELLANHQDLFISKYGFDSCQYAVPDRALISQITFEKDMEFNVLQLDCGLGAELKLLRSKFPRVHAVGIEESSKLRDIVQNIEIVFQSLEEVEKAFSQAVFDVVIVRAEKLLAMSEGQRAQLAKICKRDCLILQERKMYRQFPFAEIKLVIWDLDETFWKGTLSEGEIQILPENVELIQKLTDCGVINSISSKNRQEEVWAVLEQNGLDELFVFSQINWENKGEQITQKLKQMGLRAENVLFIDDNVHNLEEAKFHNPGIYAELPDILPALYSYVNTLAPTDLQHMRLQQYQLLEKKNLAQNKYVSTEDFLYDSQIQVEICHDCLEQLDRITELVSRTNQLNYTKVRDSREVLERLLSNDWMDAGYIRVSDRFGEYGIVGFYCVNRREEKVEHFLFSCRVMGMHVEQYVFARLNYPKIEVALPVAVELKPDMQIPWISEKVSEKGKVMGKIPLEEGAKQSTSSENKMRILLKGPCDLSAMEAYLTGARLTTEFNYVNSQGFITTGQNHSMHIWESAHCTKEEIQKILAEVPFLTEGDFETLLFEREYHVICYSLLPDSHTGLYRNRRTGNYISFGSCNFDLTEEANWPGYIDGTIVNHAFPFDRNILQSFAENWEFVSRTGEEELLRNLQYMYDNVPGKPMWILLLGSEKECEKETPEFAGHAKYHQEVNRIVEAFAKGKDRIKLIHTTDYIVNQEDYADCINHFSREVYYRIAGDIVDCINGITGKESS